MAVMPRWLRRLMGRDPQKPESQPRYVFDYTQPLPPPRVIPEPKVSRERRSSHLVPVAILTSVGSCWAVASVHTTFSTVFWFGIVVPVLVTLTILRVARGSKRAAEIYAYEQFPKRRLSYERWELPKYAQQKVRQGEIIRGIFREHPIALLKFSRWMLGSFALELAAGFVGTQTRYISAALIMAIIGTIAPGLRVWIWSRAIFIITDDRLLRVSGIIQPTVDMMPKGKLTDAAVIIPARSTILSRLRIIYLPYGTIRFESAGQDQALSVVNYLPGVNEVSLLVSLVVKDEAGTSEKTAADD